MADHRGIVRIDHDGKEYRLEMNFGVMADLEDRHPEDFAVLIEGSKPPKFKMMVDAVRMSLIEGTPDIEGAEASRIARKITSPAIFADLVAAAFPDAQAEAEAAGNGKAPKRAA